MNADGDDIAIDVVTIDGKSSAKMAHT